MKNARLLSLTGKNLSNIPDSVMEDAKFAEVTCIDLSRNRLNELPYSLSQVKTVTDLKLSCNKFMQIPAWIGELQHIQFLDLNRNLLNSLPENISLLEHLREINISFNRYALHFQTTIIKEKAEKLINLFFSRFVEVPACIYEITHLEILVANDNKIAKIDVPALNKLRRLATLDLSNNNIGYVPPELGKLIHLRYILFVCKSMQLFKH